MSQAQRLLTGSEHQQLCVRSQCITLTPVLTDSTMTGSIWQLDHLPSRLDMVELIRKLMQHVASGGLTALPDGSFSRCQCSLLQLGSAAGHVYDNSTPALHGFLQKIVLVELAATHQTEAGQRLCTIKLYSAERPAAG